MASDGCIEAHGIPECPVAAKRIYDNHVHTYEDYVSERGYTAYKRAADVLLEFVPDLNAEILDLCAGTGMAGPELFRHGYKNLSAHDGSAKMLQKAAEKGVFKHFYEELLYADRPIKTIPHGHFDGILCCASFLPGHLSAAHIPTIAQLLKPNGVIVILTRKSCYHACEGEQSDNVSEAERQYREEHHTIMAELLKESHSGMVLLHEETTMEYGHNKAGIIYVLSKQ